MRTKLWAFVAAALALACSSDGGDEPAGGGGAPVVSFGPAWDPASSAESVLGPLLGDGR